MKKKELKIISYAFLITLASFASVLMIRGKDKENPFLLLALFLFTLILLAINIRKGKRARVKIGLLLAVVHLFFCVRLLFAIRGGAVGLDAGVIMLFDIFLMPIYFFLDKLFPCSCQFNLFALTITYGILGTLCWFFIPIGIASLVEKLTRPKVKEQSIKKP